MSGRVPIMRMIEQPMALRYCRGVRQFWIIPVDRTESGLQGRRRRLKLRIPFQYSIGVDNGFEFLIPNISNTE